MSEPAEIHHASLQYQAHTNKHGHAELRRILLALGELRNASIHLRNSLTRHAQKHWVLPNGKPNFKRIRQAENNSLTDLRKHQTEYEAVARKVQQAVMQNVDTQFRRYYADKGGKPKTHSPHDTHTLEISEPSVSHIKLRKSGTAGIHIKGLPHIWFKTDGRIPMLEQPKTIRITVRNRTITATLVYAVPNYPAMPAIHDNCGIDPGIAVRLTVVNDQGQYYTVETLSGKEHRELVRKLNRAMQRCRDAAIKDERAYWQQQRRADGTYKSRFRWKDSPSKNYIALRAQLREVEHKRTVRTRNHEHRITTEIVRTHQQVFIEDTQITNMVKSAKGTLENPGTNVAQKRGLNRSIHEQRWGSCRSQLEYKCQWYQREYARTPAAYSSKTCLRCGHMDRKNRLTQAQFRCVKCDHGCNADIVGAENSRRRGLETTAGAGDTAKSPVNRRNPAMQGSNQQGLGSQPSLLMFTEIRAPVC